MLHDRNVIFSVTLCTYVHTFSHTYYTYIHSHTHTYIHTYVNTHMYIVYISYLNKITSACNMEHGISDKHSK